MSGDEGLNFLHKICQYLDRDHNTLEGKYKGRVPLPNQMIFWKNSKGPFVGWLTVGHLDFPECGVGCPKKPKSPNFGTQLNPVVFID